MMPIRTRHYDNGNRNRRNKLLESNTLWHQKGDMLSRELKDRLIERCSMGWEQFEDEFSVKAKTCSNGGKLIHLDRGSDVLAVAHLDYVGYTNPHFTRQGRRINAMQLDDRLGAWIILDYLPSLGLDFDVLLTDCEEVGDSTGQFFRLPEYRQRIPYNWMFQFDRAGDDFVAYDYDDTDLVKDFGAYTGIHHGWGAFTDICYMTDLGSAAINVGCGYELAHSTSCYADLEDTLRQCHLFAQFFQNHARTFYPYVPSVHGRGNSAGRWSTRRIGQAYASGGWDMDDATMGRWNDNEYHPTSGTSGLIRSPLRSIGPSLDVGDDNDDAYDYSCGYYDCCDVCGRYRPLEWYESNQLFACDDCNYSFKLDAVNTDDEDEDDDEPAPFQSGDYHGNDHDDVNKPIIIDGEKVDLQEIIGLVEQYKEEHDETLTKLET